MKRHLGKRPSSFLRFRRCPTAERSAGVTLFRGLSARRQRALPSEKLLLHAPAATRHPPLQHRTQVPAGPARQPTATAQGRPASTHRNERVSGTGQLTSAPDHSKENAVLKKPPLCTRPQAPRLQEATETTDPMPETTALARCAQTVRSRQHSRSAQLSGPCKNLTLPLPQKKISFSTELKLRCHGKRVPQPREVSSSGMNGVWVPSPASRRTSLRALSTCSRHKRASSHPSLYSAILSSSGTSGDSRRSTTA